MKNLIRVFLVAGILLMNPTASQARLTNAEVESKSVKELFPFLNFDKKFLEVIKSCAGYIGDLNSVTQIIGNGSKLEVYHCTQDQTSFEAAGGDAKLYGSIAMGRFSITTSKHGIAIGSEALAGTSESTALGFKSIANGDQATALGARSSATGETAIAIGVSSRAKELNSIAIGNFSTANGQNALSILSASMADGREAIAIGDETIAQGDTTIAIGSSAEAKENYALAIGSEAKAEGQFTTAIGRIANAQRDYATAIGVSSNAVGRYATSLSGNAQADFALALGTSSNAIGKRSISIGVNTHAENPGSLAMGEMVSSFADNAFTIGRGYHTNSGGMSSLVNSTQNSLIVGFNSSTPTLFVGDSVSNGNTGSVGIGTINPSAKLDVAGNMKVQETISAKSLQIQKNARIGSVIVNKTLSAGKLASDSIVAGTLTSSLIVNHGLFASGGVNSVSGEGSATIGMRNRSEGNSAITLGYKNMAVRTIEKASGQPEEAKGPVALGYENIARGTGSIAMGSSNKAEAEHSIAIGQHATANGESSIVIGHDITNNHENSLLIGFQESTAIFATTGLTMTKRMKDLERNITNLESRIEYYSPYAARYAWLKAHIDRWIGNVENYKTELAELMGKSGNQPRVGINTNEPKRSLHISGVMRLEPLPEAPINPAPGDIFMHKSGALCVYIQSWEVIAGSGSCY
ncbi:MAG: hypothetical protein O3C63_09325 [Cyanobacteria bacterium]|nr:hypothetical protein [Cyanobacteriota bacterium]